MTMKRFIAFALDCLPDSFRYWLAKTLAPFPEPTIGHSDSSFDEAHVA